MAVEKLLCFAFGRNKIVFGTFHLKQEQNLAALEFDIPLERV
jgi:hypothetical protein